MVNIMIADDNINACRLISNIVSNDKNIRTVNISMNGLEALSNYMKLKPDVLILDLQMPGITGQEIIKTLNEREKNSDKIKKNIIVVSGDIPSVPTIYDDPKVYSYFYKPFNYDQLLNDIRNIKKSNYSDKFLEQNVETLLSKFHLNNSNICVKYLKESIVLAYDKPIFINKNNILLEQIARNNNKNYRAIRSAIDKVLKNITIPNELEMYFYDIKDGKSPSLKVLIEQSIDYLKDLYTK